MALLLSPGKEVSKKPAPDARHSTRQQSRQICLWHNICVVVVTRQSQRLPSLLRLASVAPERFCGASQLLRNLCFLVSPARFLRGGTAQGACGPLKKPRGKKWVAPRIASCNSMEHGLWSALRASQDTRSPGLPYLCAGQAPQAGAWGQPPSPSRFPFCCPKARL